MTNDAIPRTPHPFSVQPGYDEDGRPDANPTPAVATPVHPGPVDPEPDDQAAHSSAQPSRLRAWWDAAIRAVRTLPEALREPANFKEIWAYAKAGAFTTRTDGGGVLRRGNLAWAVVSAPFVMLYLTALWAQPRPGRFAAFVVTLLVVGTGAAQIPLLSWLVPPLFNVTAW